MPATEPLQQFANATTATLTEITKNLGQLALWLQAIGILIILWIVFNIISLINQIIKRKKLSIIENRLETIEQKLNKLIKK